MVKIVALFSVFGLGVCFTLLGSISVKLMPRLKIDQAKFGSLISAFMLTCLIASLVTGVVVDKFGYKPVAIFGFIATAACIFVFAAGKTYVAVLIPCLLLGFGAMAMNTVGNTLIPVVLFNGENPVAASNLGNVFCCLGLFLTPLIVSFLFKKTSYEKAIAVLGVIVLVPVIFAVMAEYPQSSVGFSIKDAVALLKVPAILLAGLALFCYISLEATFCNWLPPYGKEVITKDLPGLDNAVIDATSQQMLSVFAIAMMVGRLIASQIEMITVHGSWFVAGAALISAFIILAMRKSTAIWISVLAGCAGLAFAPCFPTIIGVIYSKCPENFGSVFGIIFAVGLLGAVLVPKAIGNLAKDSSVQKSLNLLLPICILLIIFALMLGKAKGV